MLLALIPLLFANVVTIDAVATGVEEGAIVEFLMVGPDSDHGYESMFTTVESPAAIARKFADAGIPVGHPVSYSACRFWPVGCNLQIDPAFEEFVIDTADDKSLSPLYTGGIRDLRNIPIAGTNMPSAVFALYSLPQSLIQLDDALDQSAAYGRFKAAKSLKKGSHIRFSFSSDLTRPIEYHAKFSPGNAKDALSTIKALSATNEVDLLPSFSPELELRDAISIASALQKIDSPLVKVNGFEKGQFFYRAFLPLEKWKDRKERLTQPYEVRISGGNRSITVIEEDWSDADTLEPKLIVTDNVDFKTLESRDDPVDTCFIYASAETRLGDLYAVIPLMPGRVVNWYVFQE